MYSSNILFLHDAQQNYRQIEYLFASVALFLLKILNFFITFFLTADFWMRIHREKIQDISHCLGHRLDWVHVLLVEVLKGLFRHDS